MDLSDLNPQQKNAVINSLNNNTVVIAGAGSGKTKTLTKRVGYLLDDMGVLPQNIMAVTFTNKAANELKQRLFTVCSEINKMWVGTFHSVCVKILKNFGSYIGIKSFSILSTYESKKILATAIKEAGIPADKPTINKYMTKISNYKNEFINADCLLKQANTNDDVIFANAYKNYQNIKWKSKTFDFDDLIIYSAILIKNSKEVANWFKQNIKYYIVDESQDMNSAQFSLIYYLAQGNNIFLVGDDSQSIYKFRGAKPGYLLNFDKYFPDGKILMLEQNYRSTKTIVNASNAVVNCNKVKFYKKCFSENEIGDPIVYHKCDDAEDEAAWVANDIFLQQGIIDINDIAILYRTNAQSRQIEQELMKLNIPYKLVGATSFYDRKEIKDIMAFVKFIANDKDKESFKRAIGSLSGIGKNTVDKIIEIAEDNSISYAEAFGYVKLTAKGRKSYDDFNEMLANVTDIPSDLIKLIIDKTGILSSLIKENTEDSLSRIDNIKELINVAIEQENNDNRTTVQDFINNVSLMSTNDTEKSKGVSLMTIHASKGLEFNSVYIIGMEEGYLPHVNSLSRIEDIEEERRLCYVAMTRAKKNLYLTSCKSRFNENGYITSNESRFLKEIPKQYLVIS